MAPPAVTTPSVTWLNDAVMSCCAREVRKRRLLAPDASHLKEYLTIHCLLRTPVYGSRRFVPRCAVFCCAIALTWCAAPLVASADSVLQVAASSVELPVAVELPAGTTAAAASAWQLVQEGSDVSLPVQIGAAISDDGTPAAERQRLLAVIPPSGEVGAVRRFRLVQSPAAPAAAFEFADVSAESLQLREGDRPVYVYNHGVITRQEIPEQNHLRSRGCYMHPLYGLSGEVLTDDFPPDHFHHHGVFWTWPHVQVEQQEHDLWAGATIRQKFVRWLARETGPVAAVLAVENGWYVGEELVMVERIWMRAFRAAENDRAIDMELYFTPVKPITLQGAAEKSYGGLTVRFAPGPREETRITVPSGPTTEDLPDTPLAWADFTSRFGKMEHPSGAAIFVSVRHPDYPPTWLTRHYGAQCVGWPGVKARSFEPGKPFKLDYRLWLHRQAAAFGQLQEAYQGYTRATEVQWDDNASPGSF
ncbi:MAG: DUF6807 family protein [Pirellulaceae bacterium]